MPLGPAKLEVRDCVVDTSLSAIMKLVLREGCIGETVAALEALDDAATATDPVIEGVLRRIACDEQAHAELGYRFLGWALAGSSAEARGETAQAAAQQLIAFEREAGSGTAHGRARSRAPARCRAVRVSSEPHRPRP
jgi:hypothetical protein